MRKAIVLFAIVGALAVVLAPGVSAGNTPSGNNGQVACGFGSCFVPSFTATLQTNSYSGPAASVVEFADCCTAGDTYKVTVKGPGAYSSTTKWTSTGALNGDCSVGPYLDSNAVTAHDGATKVLFKSIALPGGIPASAYVRMSAGGWAHTAGPADSCGF
jgi:hypothetical protein